MRPAQLGRAAPADKPPMTPPRVSGISLAPAPHDADHHSHGPSAVSASGAAGHSGKIGGRISQTQLSIGGKAPPHPANNSLSGALSVGGGVAAGAGAGNTGSGAAAAAAGAGGAGSAAPLIAEGRSIQRGTAAGLQLDPRLVVFHEINGGGAGDSDSVCSTPVLNVRQLTRHDGDGAFGPLTPHPLSPSILTLCAQPGLDDQFEFGGVARATGELVDMRLCDSPRLPSS
ncbi:hypothetical protein HYH02_009386 [Chlamydomonas schloesseri]|uniref:Uncharacterized protein n=1 Tax=Chlamydomonas schloesseri TaxID=2026947 RepID=A0A835TDA7_9CHLO|nr:hypothetical protein HYH02_009386 [Chlamydomonas schloesseri]|eukprot:KAG2443319.1 hypothetical protein HYH02_009386 [Chlamydomonas schloesseri]